MSTFANLANSGVIDILNTSDSTTSSLRFGPLQVSSSTSSRILQILVERGEPGQVFV